MPELAVTGSAALTVLTLLGFGMGETRRALVILAFDAVALAAVAGTHAHSTRQVVSGTDVPTRLARNAVGWALFGLAVMMVGTWRIGDHDAFNGICFFAGGLGSVGIGVFMARARRRLTATK